MSFFAGKWIRGWVGVLVGLLAGVGFVGVSTPLAANAGESRSDGAIVSAALFNLVADSRVVSQAGYAAPRHLGRYTTHRKAKALARQRDNALERMTRALHKGRFGQARNAFQRAIGFEQKRRHYLNAYDRGPQHRRDDGGRDRGRR